MDSTSNSILSTLCDQIRSCAKCTGIRSEAMRPVPPEFIGNIESGIKYWAIFRNPGSTEDAEGRPISPNAPVGALGRNILVWLGIYDGCLISNSVFCATKGDRPLKEHERNACAGSFKADEFSIAKDCSLIICFGKDAAALFLKYNSFSEILWKFFKVNVHGKLKNILVVHHPGYLIRKPTELIYTKDHIFPALKEQIGNLRD